MPVYRTDDAASVMSDTMTLADRPDPPTATLLLPGHSTRASLLSYHASQGKYSALEYLALTCSLMFTCNSTIKPLVVAIDEDFDILLDDIQRYFGISPGFMRLKELHVHWGPRTFGVKGLLQRENIVAMMRLIKSRNGQDMVMAK